MEETDKRNNKFRLIIFAFAMVLLGAGIYLFTSRNGWPGRAPIVYTNDAGPGRNNATLTLSTGKRIQLSAMTTGQVIKEPGVSITKTAEGKLIYKTIPGYKGEIKYNILTTNNGEQARLSLVDGTVIWMNTSSNLRFPVSFSGLNHRAVQLSGEACFEVFKDKKNPFIVKTNMQEIRVAGTRFNVNNYVEEPIAKTTMLEGNVVINNENEVLPGQQAAIMGTSVYVSKADTSIAMAWRNGKFVFKGEKIKDIMKILARWYNVEVIYEGEAPEDKFDLSGSRYAKLSKILEQLEMTGDVHFKIGDRTVTVRQ